MTWYQMSLGDANRVPRPFIATAADFGGRDWLELYAGRRIEAWEPASRLRSCKPEHDGDPDDVLANAFGIPVFSPQLRSALAAAAVAEDDIQYLPVRVARSTGEEVDGFAISNVVSRLQALDARRCAWGLELSYNETDPLTGKPKVRGIRRAALKAALLGGHGVIRLLEFFPPLYVSESFVTAFDNGGFTGATFVPVETA